MSKKWWLEKWGYITLFTILTIIFAGPLGAQSLDWQRTYGGTQSDYGYSTCLTADGGYVIAGQTKSFGDTNGDIYLIKTSEEGDTLWTKNYGGNSIDMAYSVEQTADGGYIIAGYTYSYGAGQADVYLIKTNSSGDTLWTKTYGGSDYDIARSVRETQDGGYIITGTTESYGPGFDAVYLIRTDANGDTLWTKTYGGASYDFGYSVKQTADKGFIIAGATESYGNKGRNVYLIKVDSIGDTVWTRTFGGDSADYGMSVIQAHDGGYVVTGWTGSYGPDEDIYLIKTDASGDSVWTRTYRRGTYGHGYSVIQTSDNAYVITGSIQNGSSTDYDIYFLKVNLSGDTLWTGVYGGSGRDMSYSVFETDDHKYVVAGYTRSYGAGNEDVYLIKIRRFDLLSPNGGEVMRGGQSYPIVFQYDSCGVDHISLYYSTDAGGTYNLIADNISPSDTEYIWTVPYVNSTDCRIKAQAVSSSGDIMGEDTSDSSFTIDSQGPSQVQLVLPENNSYANNTYVYFVWHSVTDNFSGVQYYLYQRADDSDFTLNVAETNVGLDTASTIFIPDSVHYWRVRAIDSVGNAGAWSSIRKLSIDTHRPGPPPLQSPTNNTWIGSLSVVFEWSGVTRYFNSPIEAYILEVDTVASFADPIIVDTTEFLADTVMLNDGHYYWRVMAYDIAGNEGAWSSAWQLEVDAHAPDAPVLQNPDNNTWIATDNVVFEWSGVARYFKSQVSYILEVDTTNTFASPIAVDTTLYTSDSISLTDGAYYWRVHAYDAAGNVGAYSDTFQFTVDITPPTIDSVTVWSDTGYYFGPFEVEAKAWDNIMLNNPILNYRVGTGTWMEDTMSALSGDFYTGTIPEVDSQDNVIIEYYLTAEDYAGNTTRNPDTGSYLFVVSIKERSNSFNKYQINRVSAKGNMLIIEYGVPARVEVTLRLYDLSGRVVKSINNRSDKGYNRVNISLNPLHRGIYFIEMKAGKYREMKKVVLFK